MSENKRNLVQEIIFILLGLIALAGFILLHIIKADWIWILITFIFGVSLSYSGIKLVLREIKKKNEKLN